MLRSCFGLLKKISWNEFGYLVICFIYCVMISYSMYGLFNTNLYTTKKQTQVILISTLGLKMVEVII